MQDDCCVETPRESAEPQDPPNQPVVTSRYNDTVIKKVTNGFIVVIGCQTFVSKEWKEIADGLAEYWQDPRKAEKKFCK